MAIDLEKYLNYAIPKPTYLEKLEEVGLITAKDLENAKKQSMFQGLLGAGLTYLAQPKNMGYGSAFDPRYLAKPILTGLQYAGTPYEKLSENALMSKKIEDIGIQKRNRDMLNKNIANLNKMKSEGNAPNNMAEWYRQNVIPYTDQETQIKLLTPQLEKKQIGDKMYTYNQFGEQVGEPEEIGLTKYQQESLNESKRQHDIQMQKSQAQIDIWERQIAIQEKQLEQGRIPAGYERTEDGLRPIKGGPADIKLQEKGAAANQLDSLLTSLKDDYNTLNKSGDIVNVESGALPNVGASIQASDFGQWVGSKVGTKSQSVRNNIEQKRPLILQAIKQATGMSSKQMDSNRELQFYLSAATDPKLGYQENMKAIDMLDKLFVQGLDKQTGYSENGGVPKIPTTNNLSSSSFFNDVTKEIERRKSKGK